MSFSGKSAALAATALILICNHAATALADDYLGTYVARLSHNDHHASDGYALDTAAQVVRQDRANMHKFNDADDEDVYDEWFSSAQSRAKLEAMLNKSGAMSQATRNAIQNGTPLVDVEVYRNSVKVSIISK